MPDNDSSLPGGNTRTVIYAEPFLITWASGKDSTLTSIDGHVYTDFLGESAQAYSVIQDLG